jgi:hypothetical protein
MMEGRTEFVFNRYLMDLRANVLVRVILMIAVDLSHPTSPLMRCRWA